MPQELFFLEPYIYKYINDNTARGRVDVYFSAEKNGGARKLVIDERLFEKSVMVFKKLYKKAGIKGPVVASDILANIDGIARLESGPASAAITWEKVKPVLAGAFKDFTGMKNREGARLAADIRKKASRIRAESAKIKALYIKFRAVFVARARKRAAEILDGENEKRVLSAGIVEVLEKYDITEELVRINSHLVQIEAFLKLEKGAGRKLDFLAQELYREANTIASKIPDSDTAHSVIMIKECTDKIREQAQNLE